MKLAFILTQSLESPSGLGRFWPMAYQLAHRGHDVSIFALHPDIASLPQKIFIRNGVNVHYLAPMHVKKAGNIKSYYSSGKLLLIAAQAAWQLSAAALRTQADAICICKPHPMNSIAGLAARYLRGKTLFLDCDDYETGSNRFQTRWQREGVALFETWVPSQVKLITTNTLFTRDRLLEAGRKVDQVYYLPNGVERQRFLPPLHEQIEEIRQKLDIVGKKVILYLGSLSLSSHPVNLLIEAYAYLLQNYPQARLLIVGGGEDYENLTMLVQKLGLDGNVYFTGRVPPEQAVLYYHLANVSVDPVHDDSAACGRSPLKLFESWACGIPVVTSWVGDRQALLGNPPAGVMCKPGDVESLAQAIHTILVDEKFSQALSNYGHQRVQEYYWDRLVEGLEAIYLDKLPKAGSQ